LFPEHGDIQNVSYTAQRQTDLSLKICFILGMLGCINVFRPTLIQPKRLPKFNK